MRRPVHIFGQSPSLRTPWRFAMMACLIALNACGSREADDDKFERDSRAIINGEPDVVHQAVVALVSPTNGCTGTIVAVRAPNAFVLTAAHCVTPQAPTEVRIGDDSLAPDAVLDVVEHQVHPNYDAQKSKYDFAMIRATGATVTTPSIAPLRSGEQELMNGDPVTHVGYGLTAWPAGTNTLRHYVEGAVSQVYPEEFDYLQTDAGPCSGDSGGPNLVLTPSGERVAGVVSYGDMECDDFGVSGRVSHVHDSFIAPFTGDGAGASTGTGGVTGGSPQAGPVSVHSVATSGCGVASPRGVRGVGYVVAIMVLFVASVRRRRGRCDAKTAS